MRALLDKHAPQVFVRAIRRQCAPWHDEEWRVTNMHLRCSFEQSITSVHHDRGLWWKVPSRQAVRSLFQSRSTKAFDVFDSVAIDEVIKLLRISPSKHCSLDPGPTWLLKRTTVFNAPLICSMCNVHLYSPVICQSLRNKPWFIQGSRNWRWTLMTNF